MKHIILYTIGIFFSLAITAQETSLTINVTPGKLKEAMTEREMQYVKNLTLIGEMDNSDFYVIRDNMKMLEVLDMEKVIADTIPKKLFFLSKIIKVVLPISLKIIQADAFCWCDNLTTVVWNNFPQEIENSAFVNCNQLFRFEVTKANVECTSIDGVLFSIDEKRILRCPNSYGADYLIPDGVEVIENSAFGGTLLRSITIPPSVKYIEEKGLYTGLTIGPKVVFAGKFPETANTAFLYSNCALSVSEDNNYCKMIDKYLCSKDGKTLYLADYEFRDTRYIPHGVEKIAPRAFCMQNMPFYGYLVIPSSVNYIGDEAFAYLHIDVPTGLDDLENNIPTLYCYSVTPPSLGKNVFAYYNSYLKFDDLFVPKGSLTLYQSDEQWKNVANRIVEMDDPNSILSLVREPKTSIEVLNGEFRLSSQNIIRQIELIDIKGYSLYHKDLFNTEFSFSDKWGSGIYLVKVVYQNGKNEWLKIIK